MKIESVTIKGKIAGIKTPVQIVMDEKTFDEWREKVEVKKASQEKVGFWGAFWLEFKKVILLNSKPKIR